MRLEEIPANRMFNAFGEANHRLIRDFLSFMREIQQELKKSKQFDEKTMDTTEHEEALKGVLIACSVTGGDPALAHAFYMRVRLAYMALKEISLPLSVLAAGTVRDTGLLALMGVPKENRYITYDSCIALHSRDISCFQRLIAQNVGLSEAALEQLLRPPKGVVRLEDERRYFWGIEAVKAGFVGQVVEL